MADKITAIKTFPDSYPEDAVAILEAMSFGFGGRRVELLGSMALRSQKYAGDYDGFEVVKLNYSTENVALNVLANRFKQMVLQLQKMPNLFIGDIKAGSVEEWRVLPEGKIDWSEVASKVKALRASKIITPEEETSALKIVRDRDGITAREFLKFHIVRWKPFEVLRGFVKLRDGRKMTLQQAFSSPTIAKLDTIGLVQGDRFTEFSVIYEFQNKDVVLNPAEINVEGSLMANITALKKEGNYFKALKRKFALAKYNDNRREISELSDILNSDLGLLYQIITDMRTLVSVLTHPDAPLTVIRTEINRFKQRLSNVYSITEYVKEEPAFFRTINRIAALKRPKMALGLSEMADSLDKILQTAAKRYIA